jgi:hypothetical protein
MGINTQTYLSDLFKAIRNQHGWVEPVCRTGNATEKPKNPPPAALLHIGGKK